MVSNSNDERKTVEKQTRTNRSFLYVDFIIGFVLNGYIVFKIKSLQRIGRWERRTVSVLAVPYSGYGIIALTRNKFMTPTLLNYRFTPPITFYGEDSSNSVLVVYLRNR